MFTEITPNGKKTEMAQRYLEPKVGIVLCRHSVSWKTSEIQNLALDTVFADLRLHNLPVLNPISVHKDTSELEIKCLCRKSYLGT